MAAASDPLSSDALLKPRPGSTTRASPMPAALPCPICCAQFPPWRTSSESAVDSQLLLLLHFPLSLFDTSITAEGQAVLAAALGRTELDNLE